MSSSVFFKFKSQKEPTRVEFDGTAISVFELKREIILRSGLGDGSDFDLVICADEGMKEVYDDDTTLIPRSTTVIARRMPPRVPGKGSAARYVSGKMPLHAKNSSRKEHVAKPTVKAQSTTMAQLSSAMTEEEKMAAVFQAQTENFTAREEEMATQQYVAKGGPKKPANVPDHDPPQGYICYRCGEKGHWIQLCPTNDNPEYDNRPRVKRTTGIPKSFLKTVDRAMALGQHGDGDDSKTPSGIMVNADGEFVIAEPDKAAWELFQAKAKSSTAAQKSAPEGDKEVQERGLECSLDKKMFIDPMQTPCCEKTYCNDCITNALIESDFVCPGCKSDGILIDDLKPDEVAAGRIKEFLAEKNSKARAASKSPKSPTAADPKPSSGAADSDTQQGLGSKSPVSSATGATSQPSQTQPTPSAAKLAPNGATPTGPAEQTNQTASKKRPADDLLENPRIPKAPKAMQKPQDAPQQQPNMMDPMMGGMPGMPGMGMNMGAMPMMYGGMPMMGNNYGPTPMGNMNMGMMNPMMNPMMGGMGPMGGYNMNGPGGFNGNGMWSGNGDMGMAMNGPGGNMNRMHGGPNNGVRGRGMGGPQGAVGLGPGGHGGQNGHGFQQHQPQFHQQHQQHQQMPHHFHQQQMPMHKNFGHQQGDDDDAYFRKPVNPHRHQNRQRRVRPSDYREL